jgi:hypothetical protein
MDMIPPFTTLTPGTMNTINLEVSFKKFSPMLLFCAITTFLFGSRMDCSIIVVARMIVFLECKMRPFSNLNGLSRWLPGGISLMRAFQ